jgi:hypothetical protein
MISTLRSTPGRWATALQWPDGSLGWAYVSLDGKTLHVEVADGTAVLSPLALADGMRYLSASAAPFGQGCCCGQGQDTGQLQIACCGVMLPPQGNCLSKPAIRRTVGGWEIAVARTADRYDRLWVSDIGGVDLRSAGLIRDGAGGSGLVGWDSAGEPIAGAHAYTFRTADGRTLYRPASCPGVVVGQPTTGGGLGAWIDGQTYITIEGQRLANTPSVAGRPARFCVATVGGASWDEVWMAICEAPFTHEPLPPPPPPKPATVLPDYSSCVGAYANRLGLGGPAKAFAVVSASVIQIRHDGDPRVCLVASGSALTVRGCHPYLVGLKLEDGRLALITVVSWPAMACWMPWPEKDWPADQSKAREPYIEPVAPPAPPVIVPPPVRPLPAFCKGLNCGGLVDGLIERGVEMTRFNAERPIGATAPQCRGWWDRGAEVMVIVQSVLDCEQIPKDVPRVHVECANEPDAGTDKRYTPADYVQLVRDVMAWAGDRRLVHGQDIRVWAGALSNFSASAFAYLEQILPGLPAECGITMHWYPDRWAIRGPRPGFESRAAEVLALTSRIGSRPWGISETGWHTAPQSSGWWIFKQRWQWTDVQVRDVIRAELAWWQSRGAAFAVIFQINCGPTNTFIDRFGIRNFAGQWLPQAGAFK